MQLLATSNFWVLVSFAGFIGLLVYFGVPARVMGLLDARAAGIKAELDEARALREDAQALLDAHEGKIAGLKDETRAIIDAAEAQIRTRVREDTAQNEARLSRRAAHAQDEIVRAQEAAIANMRKEAARLGMAAAREILAQDAKADDDALMRRAMDDVKNTLAAE